MTTPLAPRIQKAGLILMDPASGVVKRVIALQYNPDSLQRTLQVQAASGEGADRSEALRLKGPPVETFKLDAEMDATDQLEVATPGSMVAVNGLLPQLAALEAMIYPSSAQLSAANAAMMNGAVEIVPMEAPLTLFVWSTDRVAPVRVTEFSVTEEAFDVDLKPIRAKVSLSLRVLSVNDLSFGHRGGAIYMAYLQRKEQLAAMIAPGVIAQVGLGAIP